MTNPRATPAGALLCLLMLYLMVKTTITVSVARPSGFVRQRRSLTFPYGFDESYLEFIFGVGLPMDLPHPYQVLMSFEIRADYRYPVNASDFTNPTKRQEEKEKEMEEKEEKAVAHKAVGRDDVIPSRTVPTILGGDSKKFKYGGDVSIVKVVTPADVKIENTTKQANVSSGRSEDEKINQSKYSEGAQVHKDSLYLNGTIIKQSNHTEGVNNNESFVEEIDLQNEVTTLKYVDDETDVEGGELDFDDSEEGEDDEDRGARSIHERDTESASTRWRIYHVLEMAGNNLGMDGRACILRSICDAAATPLNHHSNGLVGELVHILLTPSTTDDDRGRYSTDEYHSAERLGAQVGNKCRLLYPECPVSFLDMFTKFDL